MNQIRSIFSGTQVDAGLPGAREGRTMRGACSGHGHGGEAEHWDPPGREQISLGAGEAWRAGTSWDGLRFHGGWPVDGGNYPYLVAHPS